jgi:hypothetical protein
MLGRLPPVQKAFDLRDTSPWTMIAEAFETLWHGGQRTIRVFSPSPQDPRVLVDVSLPEQAMWNAMVDYSWRILALSVVLSLLTALLVYTALQGLMVRPLRRITESVMAFRRHPEDAEVDLPRSAARLARSTTTSATSWRARSCCRTGWRKAGTRRSATSPPASSRRWIGRRSFAAKR